MLSTSPTIAAAIELKHCPRLSSADQTTIEAAITEVSTANRWTRARADQWLDRKAFPNR